MLRPDEFRDIFIAMGPFHWSKICIAAIGKFLEPSGITDALAKSGAFGKGVAETNVMMDKDYVQGKEGMGIMAEAMTLNCSLKHSRKMNCTK